MFICSLALLYSCPGVSEYKWNYFKTGCYNPNMLLMNINRTQNALMKKAVFEKIRFELQVQCYHLLHSVGNYKLFTSSESFSFPVECIALTKIGQWVRALTLQKGALNLFILFWEFLLNYMWCIRRADFYLLNDYRILQQGRERRIEMKRIPAEVSDDNMVRF